MYIATIRFDHSTSCPAISGATPSISAMTMLGTGNYRLGSHNCEHLAFWTHTGAWSSEQVKAAAV